MDAQIQQEFDTAYEEYADSIFRYLFLKTRDRQVALDLTQDAFIQTWEYLAKGKSINAMRPFLYRVAHNLWVKALRVTSRQVSLETILEQGWQPVADHDIEEEAKILEDQEAVLKRLEGLDDIYKEVLLLRYIDDFSIKDIAAMTGESENVISVRIHRGRKQLQEIYKGHE